MRSQIANLCNAVLAPVVAAREAFAERLHSVRKTDFCYVTEWWII